MIEMRWLKSVTHHENRFGNVPYAITEKRLQYRYWDFAADGWTRWLDVPTVEVEAERAAMAGGTQCT